MNGEQIIPPITDPMGAHWKQPHRRYIELDETHALMSEQTFKGLMEYSSTFPSGTYEGKMWKAQRGDKWFLAWYCPDEKPAYIGIQWREILILNFKKS
jgi:hypothetical protein